MAQSVLSDLSTLSANLFTSFWDRLADNVNLFNANSNNTIRVAIANVVGQLNKRAFYDKVSTNSRRDPAVTADRTLNGHTKSLITTPVVNRTMADDIAESDLIQDGGSVADYVANVARNMADDRLQASLSTAISALTGAIQSEAGLVEDVSGGSNNITLARINTAKGKIGDKRSMLRGCVMHSVPYGNLVGEIIGSSAESIMQVGPGLMRDDSTLGVLGMPIFVTDNDALVDAGDYLTLLLSENALVINEQDTVPLETTRNRDKASVILEHVGEYNQEIFTKGFDYTSTANPADATLASSLNWSLAVGDIKNACGVVLKTDG